MRSVPGAAIDLVGELAGEGEAADHDGRAVDLAAHDAHEGQRGIVDRRAGDRGFQDPARVRAGNRRAGPLIGDRGEMHLQVGPYHVEQIFQMLHDLAGIGRGGGHQEIVFAEPPGRAVVECEAVLAQHQAVARLADGERGKHVGVDAVEECGGVRSLHGDLAERRHVDDADGPAHSGGFADIGLFDRLPGRAVDLRAVPQADGEHAGAVLDMPVMHRRQALGLEVAVAFGSQRAERHRREGWPEAGRPGLRDRNAALRRHDGKAGNVRRLALVGRHAERGVALEVLHRDEAFAVGKPHVVGRDVVLEVDEGLAVGPHLEDGGGCRIEAGRVAGRGLAARRAQAGRPGAGPEALVDRSRRRELASERAGTNPVSRRLRRKEG